MTASIDTLKSTISSGGGLAKSNNFLVELPNFGGSMRAMNTLCNMTTMPGKNISTVDRRIGMEFEKIAYGYIVEDVTMSFYLPNDFLPKKYFNAWRSIIINENSQEAAYKTDYQRTVKIHQLRNSLPSNAFNIQVGPVGVQLPGVNDILNSFAVKKGINISTPSYSMELIDSFPTAVTPLEFMSEADQFHRMNVTLSYTNWRSIKSSQISFKL